MNRIFQIIVALLIVLLLSGIGSAADIQTSGLPQDDDLKNTFKVQGHDGDNIRVTHFQGGYLFYSVGVHPENITVSVPPGKLRKIEGVMHVVHVDEQGKSKIVFVIPEFKAGMLDFPMQFTSNCIGCFTGTSTISMTTLWNGSWLNLTAPINATSATITLNASNYYGITWNESSDAYTRTGYLAGQPVGQTLSDSLLPIQSKMKRVLMTDGGIKTYLNDSNSSLYINGTVADLSGASGQVLTEIPLFYYRHLYNSTTTIHEWDISTHPLTGFEIYQSFNDSGIIRPYVYLGTYEATLYDTSAGIYADGLYLPESTTYTITFGDNGGAPDTITSDVLTYPFSKLVAGDIITVSASAANNGVYTVVSATDTVITIATGSLAASTANDPCIIETTKNWAADVLSSVSGKVPITQGTRANFRTAAATRGAGWRQQDFYLTSAIQLLYLVEYASFYSQSTIGAGLTDWTGANWLAWNNYNPMNNAGLSNAKGNTTFNLSNGTNNIGSYMTYRGIENFFGHVWKWVDGININANRPYVSNNQADFADDTATNYTDIGVNLINANGYQSTLVNINYGFLPASVGASSSTKITDYYSQAAGWRVGIIGGHLNYGASAGFFYWYLSDAAASRSIGGRLAYIPPNETYEYNMTVWAQPINHSVSENKTTTDNNVSINLTLTPNTLIQYIQLYSSIVPYDVSAVFGYTQNTTTISETSVDGSHYTNISIKFDVNSTNGTITHTIGDATFLANSRTESVSLNTTLPNATVIRTSTQYITTFTGTVSNTTYFINITDGYASYSNTSWVNVTLDNVSVDQCTNGLSPSPSITDGLVSYWTADGCAKDWNRTSANDGTLYGGMGYNASGHDGAAWESDGKDDYVDLGTNSVLNLTNFTIMFYNNPTVLGMSNQTLSFGSGLNRGILVAHSAYKMIMTIGNGSGSVNSYAISGDVAGQWDQYAWTYNGSTLLLYRNGTLQTDTGTISSIVYADSNRYIGKGTSSFHNGKIDDFFIYNRALSNDEINTTYDASRLKYGTIITNTTFLSGQQGWYSNSVVNNLSALINYSIYSSTDNVSYGTDQLLAANNTNYSITQKANNQFLKLILQGNGTNAPIVQSITLKSTEIPGKVLPNWAVGLVVASSAIGAASALYGAYRRRMRSNQLIIYSLYRGLK